MLLKNSLEITSLKYLGHNPPLISLGHPTPDGLTLVIQIQPSDPFVLRERRPGLGEGRDSLLCHRTNSPGCVAVAMKIKRVRHTQVHVL